MEPPSMTRMGGSMEPPIQLPKRGILWTPLPLKEVVPSRRGGSMEPPGNRTGILWNPPLSFIGGAKPLGMTSEGASPPHLFS